MRHSSIQFEKYTVTKSAEPDLMRIEVEKTRRAFQISRDCGLFRVPEVLDHDDAKGVAVFERIERIQPIQNVIFRTKQVKPLMETLGCALAIIHRRLTLPYEMTISLPPEFDLPGSEVFLHGDFNGYNVCFEPQSSMIVVLDWQMTAIHGGHATYGTRFFDIIWFINCMIWVPSFRYLLSDPVTPVAKCFLKSYYAEAGIPYDGEMLMHYTKSFFEKKLPFRKQHGYLRKRYLLPRSLVLTQRFIASLKTIMVK